MLGPAAVAASYVVLQLVLVLPGSGLGWDETVYLSQVSPYGPAAFFSAPRARGVSFLAAPAALLSPDPADPLLLRVFLAVASGVALFAAFAVWRPLLPARVVTLAAALFTGLWVTVYYGPQVMPNLWVAYGALIAVGCFLRAATTPGRPARGALAGTAAGVCLVGLMRPPDAVWLVAVLAGAALLVRRWRRPVLLLALAAGAAVGVAEWVVEAQLRYGGTVARLRRASEIQGDLGWHPAVTAHLRALEGRTLCRPCDVAWRRPVTGLWWLLGTAAVAAGLWTARPTAGPTARGLRSPAAADRPAALPLAAAAGAALGLPYLLLVGYAAPRFLLPAYALLALPAAAGVLALLSRGRVLAGTVLVALAGHLAVQYAVLDAVSDRGRANAAAFGRVAAELRGQGLRPPCVVSGYEAVRVAFRLGCSSRQVGGHDGSITAAGLRTTARDRPVALLLRDGGPVPEYARDWRRLPLTRLPGIAAYEARLAPLPSAGRTVEARGDRSANSPANRVVSSGVRQHAFRKGPSNRPPRG
ncbi:hypothetical protein [Streptomyces sp. NPDC012888]|uniref:hypothetical protein n=1 Tax=Streptomyces sp. NPDC012888 TaxID=3364855 RepID=UPI0036981A20